MRFLLGKVGKRVIIWRHGNIRPRVRTLVLFLIAFSAWMHILQGKGSSGAAWQQLQLYVEQHA